MLKNIIKILVFINLIFIIIQFPLNISFVEMEESPTLNFDKMIDGAYGREFENYFKNNSFLSGESTKFYRYLLDEYFRRPNKRVIIDKNNFLFLKERTNELSGELVDKNIDYAVKYITTLNKNLSKRDVKLVVLTFPNRSRVYPEYAYESKKIPPNRKIFYPKLIKRLIDNNISIIDAYPDMIRGKNELIDDNVFFEIDNHWTWKFLHWYTDEVALQLEKILDDKLINPASMYDYHWIKKINAHDKIARKLGYSRELIPNRFKRSQNIPKYNKNKDDYNADVEDNIMIISSSYGDYGIVESLSNLTGKYIPFYAAVGNGPTYAITSLIFRNIIHKELYGKPKVALLILSEAKLRRLQKEPEIPDIVNKTKLKEINYKITDIKKANFKNGILQHRQGVLEFNIEFDEDLEDIILGMKVKSIKKKSIIRFNGHKYDIIHSGDPIYYRIKPKNNKAKVEIETPYIKKLKIGRSFEVLGVYKEL